MRELKVITNVIDGTAEIILRGELTSINADKVSASVKSEMKKFSNISIDASELKYLSSAGIRQLILLNTMAVSKGGKLVIKKCSDTAAEILKNVGLWDTFVEK